MVNVLLHALLGLSVAALFGAGLRLAAALTEDTLAVTVSAAVFATTAAVAEALALGLVGLGTEPVPLALAALGTWAAARATLDPPRIGPACRGGRPLEGPLAGGAGGHGGGDRRRRRVDRVVHPVPVDRLRPVDLPLHGGRAVDPNGRPGSIELMNYEFPFGNYPVTNEVALAWGAGIARSFIPLALWPAVTAAVLAGSAWLGLRSLRVPRAVGIAATAAVMTVPWLVRQVNEPLTDLPSLAWLVAAGALAAFAVREDDARLLAPALVAAGLAVGTKTTALVPVAFVAALAAWQLRDRLGAAVPALGAAAVAALATGGVWYVRNLVQHGSPSWPFVAGPGGDPFRRSSAHWTHASPSARWPPSTGASGLHREPRWRPPDHRRGARGGPARPPPSRAAGGGGHRGGADRVVARPRHRADSLAANHPAGRARIGHAVPVAGDRLRRAHAAPAARHEPRARTPVVAVLAAATLWSVLESASLGLPYVPRWTTFAAGAAAGALAAAVIARLAPLSRPPRPGLAVGAALAALAGAALAPAADGYIERFERVSASTAAGRDMSAFLRRAGIGDEDSVAVVSRFLPVSLAGDHFERPLELVPRDETCAAVAGRTREGWLMITTRRFAQGVLGFEPIPASRCLRGRHPLGTTSCGSVRFFAPAD